jgi:hypothetical protein
MSSAGGTDAAIVQALYDAIWWIRCCDELLTEAHKNTYNSEKQNNGWSGKVEGLRWVRNRITHQESQWKIIDPPHKWASSASIPSNSQRDNFRSDYDAHLAGSPIWDVFGDLENKMMNFAAKFPSFE